MFYFVELFVQQEKRMRCIIYLSVVCLPLPYLLYYFK